MRKLIVILSALILISGCKDGGILMDGGVFVDTLSNTQPVKTVQVDNNVSPVVINGRLIGFEYGQTAWHEEPSDSRLVIINQNGTKELVRIEPEWINGNIDNFDEVKGDLRHNISVQDIYKSDDGGFFSFGIGSSRNHAGISELCVIRFDKDCNVIYKHCAAYNTGDYYSGNESLAPKFGAPLSGGRFAVLFFKEGKNDWYTGEVTPNEWEIMTLAPDGSIENKCPAEINNEGYVFRAYSSGNMVFIDFNNDKGTRSTIAVSSEGKTEQYGTEADDYVSSRAVYTGLATVMLHLKTNTDTIEVNENGSSVVSVTGTYSYERLVYPESEIKPIQGTDSTYYILGGTECGGSEFLYGYCKKKYTGSYSAEYIYTAEQCDGFIIKDGELFNMRGQNSTAIHGVWYENGIYTVYYKELRPEDVTGNTASDVWSNKFHIYQTDDLKKLEL